MPEFPFTITQNALLTASIDALRDLHDIEQCRLTPEGNCAAHLWNGPSTCPQLRTRLILRQVDRQPLPGAYAITVLRALLRGLAPGQEAHARVRVNGHAHDAYLAAVTSPSAERGARPTGPFDIAAHLGCGAVISPLDPQDVLALDVHEPRSSDPATFDELMEESSLGRPRVTQASAALTDEARRRLHDRVDGEVQ